MKVSEYYSLPYDQPSLDFVDVDLETDVALFIDPTALFLLDTDWGAECRGLIQNYFGRVLDDIREGNHEYARRLLARLGEPNETHLGLSRAQSRGHGMGKLLAVKMWNALRDSRMVRSGLIRDLEDTALMIDGVASDVISDIVTNIIREPLMKYTSDMCAVYGVPMQDNIASKPLWNPVEMEWETKMVSQPVTSQGRLMLVPKALVRKNITYDAGNYYSMYLLERIQEEHVSQGIVRILKNGAVRPPTKKSIKETLGFGKERNRELSVDREDVLEKYREDKRENPKEALEHGEVSEITSSPSPDWDGLLSNLRDLPSGNDSSRDYERIVLKLFNALFYPSLMYPVPQPRIHEGRKIIDISYSNTAQDDFFAWLKSHYASALVVVECKNYSVDPGNEALDQLAGRFSPSRGKFGILVCRTIENKKLMLNRCKDVVHDDRGYIIALDDHDVIELVEAAKSASTGEKLQLLRTKFMNTIS